ncbi:MAG: hypothetical protein RLZZ200_1318 [Pseudomonadota bacterium]
MTQAEPVSCLKTRHGKDIPLMGVSVSGVLRGLLLELTVEQRYVNRGRRPIESVYTFPLPVSAVLLGFGLDLDGRHYEAESVARKAAERRYEQAIDNGDSAALLTQNEEGLYTANLANLMPGETATIRYRYAEYLTIHRGVARLRIPTALTPRYGNPAAGHLEGAAIPQHDADAAYPFELRIELPDVMACQRLHSPTHALALEAVEMGHRVGLQGRGSLDRDFVIEIQGVEAHCEALVAREGREHVVMATALVPRSERRPTPLAVKLLVDCSGSMQGGSILAAREALLAGIDQLDEVDQLSLTAFGSAHQHLTEGLEPARGARLDTLRTVVRGMQAEMGGTEMVPAMKAVLDIPVTAGRRSDVLLITDGALYEVDEVLHQVEGSGHRLFVVMIGAAPNEALGKRITEKTGGAYAFASSPQEALAAIQRMFRQLREAPRRVARVVWPGLPLWRAPLPVAVFGDEPIRLYAAFGSMPAGDVLVELADGDSITTTLKLSVCPQPVAGDLIPRMAAAQRIPALPEADACQLAVHHRLASPHTSFVLVAERAEGGKSAELPIVVPVPQMVPAFLSMASLPPQISASRRESRPRRKPAARPVSPDDFLRALLDFYAGTGALPENFERLFALCGEPMGYRKILSGLLALLVDGTEAEAIRVFVASLTRDPQLPIGEALRERMDFGVSGNRVYREARRYIQFHLPRAS